MVALASGLFAQCGAGLLPALCSTTEMTSQSITNRNLCGAHRNISRAQQNSPPLTLSTGTSRTFPIERLHDTQEPQVQGQQDLLNLDA